MCRARERADVIVEREQVTRERIRQIEAKAILKLRQPDRSSILYEYVNGSTTQSVTWRAGRSKCHST